MARRVLALPGYLGSQRPGGLRSNPGGDDPGRDPARGTRPADNRHSHSDSRCCVGNRDPAMEQAGFSPSLCPEHTSSGPTVTRVGLSLNAGQSDRALQRLYRLRGARVGSLPNPSRVTRTCCYCWHFWWIGPLYKAKCRRGYPGWPHRDLIVRSASFSASSARVCRFRGHWNSDTNPTLCRNLLFR